MKAKFEKRVIYLREEAQRSAVLALVKNLPLDNECPLRVVVDEPVSKKSREQEEKYHAMIGDIAKVFVHCGRTWGPEDMKRLLIDQFRRDTLNDVDIAPLWLSMGIVDMAPAIDGSGVVMLGVQSRNFPLRLAMVFIEWLYAFGAELGVKWTG